MAFIRPCADLRNNYNEISKICHKTMQPVYITKNGYNDLVILSNEAYEKFEEERINELIKTHLDKRRLDYESFKKEVLEKIEKGLEDVKNGNYRPAEDVFQELEAKYNINEAL